MDEVVIALDGVTGGVEHRRRPAGSALPVRSTFRPVGGVPAGACGRVDVPELSR